MTQGVTKVSCRYRGGVTGIPPQSSFIHAPGGRDFSFPAARSTIQAHAPGHAHRTRKQFALQPGTAPPANQLFVLQGHAGMAAAAARGARRPPPRSRGGPAPLVELQRVAPDYLLHRSE